MKKTKSAKDLAFDKERAKCRKEIRELSSQLIKQRIDIDRLKQDIDRKDMELQEKDEWIRRLLEYMDMSEEDMRKIIQYEKPREILMFDKEGNYLASFPKSTIASEITGVCQRNILQVANKDEYRPGKVRHQAGGFIWKFKDESEVVQ